MWSRCAKVANWSFRGVNSKTSFECVPTHVFGEKMSITEAGVDLVLYHAPGETPDQVIVHWPSQDTLFPADNIYRAFPNLYAIRGTQSRYFAKSLNYIKQLRLKDHLCL